MADYISREDCIKALREYEETALDGLTVVGCISRIKRIPAANVRPAVRGKWEKHEDFDTYGGGRFVEWVCSECDKRLRGDWVIRNSNIEETPTENFCPNCGADMREEPHD